MIFVGIWGIVKFVVTISIFLMGFVTSGAEVLGKMDDMVEVF
jgi:hypothetical protein